MDVTKDFGAKIVILFADLDAIALFVTEQVPFAFMDANKRTLDLCVIPNVAFTVFLVPMARPTEHVTKHLECVCLTAKLDIMEIHVKVLVARIVRTVVVSETMGLVPRDVLTALQGLLVWKPCGQRSQVPT